MALGLVVTEVADTIAGASAQLPTFDEGDAFQYLFGFRAAAQHPRRFTAVDTPSIPAEYP